MADLDGKIKQAEAVVEDLRAATREAREALADFKAVRREWTDMRKEWEETVSSRFEKEFASALSSAFEAVAVGIDVTEKAIYRRFDSLAAIMMGEVDKESSLAELLARMPPHTARTKQRVREWRDEILGDHGGQED